MNLGRALSNVVTAVDTEQWRRVCVVPRPSGGDAAERVSEEQFRLALGGVLLGVALEMVDENRFGEVVQVNDALCRIVGRDADEFHDLTLLDVDLAQDYLFGYPVEAGALSLVS